MVAHTLTCEMKTNLADFEDMVQSAQGPQQQWQCDHPHQNRAATGQD